MLCIHARSGAHPNWPQARRLRQHGVTCGAELGLVGENFAAACGQIDRADAMLDDLRDRARATRAHRRQAWPVVDSPRITALTRQDPETQTVTLVLSVTTAIAARDTWVCTRLRAAERPPGPRPNATSCPRRLSPPERSVQGHVQPQRRSRWGRSRDSQDSGR